MKRKAEHGCSITHIGSAPAMEMKGTENIFNRSKDKGLIYTGYYGDVDSKSFQSERCISWCASSKVRVYRPCAKAGVGNRLRKLKKKAKWFNGQCH